MVDLQILTAENILAQIRKQKKAIIAFMVLLFLIGVGALVFSIVSIRREHNYGSGAIGMVICLFCCGISVVMIRKHYAILKDPRSCSVFRKYGTPEELAARIAASANNRLLDSKRVVVTDDFIMNAGDFESFVPLEAVLLVYKFVQRTNGVKNSVALDLHDEYGDKYQYPLSLSDKRNQEEIGIICNAIGQRTDRVHFGYSTENLRYVETNKKSL